MFKIYVAFTVLYVAFVIVESRVQLQRGLLSKADIESINQPYPYIFPQGARGRAVPRKGFELAEEREEDYDDEAESDDVENMPYQNIDQMPLEHRTTNQMEFDTEHAGGILVPDGVIEVKGETVYDEKTGKATLLVPHNVLEAIPNGSIVALLDSQSKSLAEDETPEERANRVLVRRRNTGTRVNVRGGKKRPRDNKRKSPRPIRKRTRRPSVHLLDLNNINHRNTNRRLLSGITPIFVRNLRN